MRSTFLVTAIILLMQSLPCWSQPSNPDNGNVVYETKELIVTRLSDDVYMHTSFFDSETFGLVPCNGMVVIRRKEAIVFDTPANETSSHQLLEWLETNAIRKIKAVVCTHFHVDCVGGLPAFHSKNIPSFAEKRTVELAKANGFHVPNHTFADSLVLSVGNRKVFATFFGEGHTVDNIVGYYPEDRVMFGGCLIKALGAGQGNLEDANVNAWSHTVEKVSKRFPGVQIVIPGHGKYGDRALLDYTVKMFGIHRINTEE